MARKTDLSLLRDKSSREVVWLEDMFKEFSQTIPDEKYYLLRWISSMTIVELHTIWERFAETRLIIALNHNP